MQRKQRQYFFRCLKSTIVVFFLVFYYNSVFSQSKTIDDYLNAARLHTASFIDYQNQLASLNFDSSKIRALYFPRVNFTSQAMIAPVIGGFGYDSAVTNGGNYNALLGVTQDLFQGGNRDLQLAKLGVQRQSLLTSRIITERDLVKTITSEYVAAYSDLYAVQSAEETLRLLNEQEQILKELVNKGVYSQLDYMNLVIARNQQNISITQARTLYRTDLYKLNQTAGILDSSNVLLEKPKLTAASAISLYQSLRSRQFSLDSLSIEYDRSLLDWTYRPKLSWFADAGLSTSDPRNAYHNFGFSIGLNLSIPIYDGGLKYFEYEKFNLSLNTIAAKSRAFFIEMNIERMMLEEELRSQDTLVAQYEKQLESISELLELQKRLLRQGSVKITDLLLTFNTLNTTKLSLRQIEISRLQTIIELNYLNK